MTKIASADKKIEIPLRQRKILHQTDSFEVVSIEWTMNSLSPEHNHGWSQCLVLIENGIFENTLFTGVKTETQILEKGQVLNVPIGARHEIRCLSQEGKTLHVYTPKVQETTDHGIFNIKTIAKLKDDLVLAEPTSIEPLIQIIKSIREHSITTASPYFMNQLFSGIIPQMLLAEDLISQTKTTLATYEASPAFSTIELEVIESLGKLIGWDHGHREGVSVPGGSSANFMAVHCARQKKIPEAKKIGMRGASLKIFVSSEAHYSFKKATVALGLGTDSLVPVPVDNRGRMLSQNLEQLISEALSNNHTPLMVCATAGTTVLGAFDPIDEISDICKKHDIWLHIDGAWGGPALFSEQSRKLIQGVEQADSFTFDAHKLFGATMTCSFFLTKHSGLLLEANDVSGGDYLFHSDDPGFDRGKLSWQCGRKADAVSFWTIWKSLGNKGLGDFVDRLTSIRDEVVDWIENQPRLELIAKPEYLNICVRVKPANQNRDTSEWSKVVREALKNENLAMVNFSTDSNGSFLRLILSHPYLNTDHVKQILQWALDVN